jgi:hypothetical protein
MRTFAILIVFAVTAFGQRHKAPEEVDAEKPDGKLMQQIMQEADPAKKNALMEQFATEFPKLPHTAWVLETIQGYYVKANQPDQVIAFGEKLLAVDPDDVEAAHQALKAAEAKKDLALVKKYSDLTSKNARKMAASPQPKEADEVASWKNEVAYAKQVGQYADYSIFKLAVESRDPKVTVELAELLQQRGAESEYAAKIRDPLFLAYRQSGATDKAIALAEKTLATEQTNEDMLLVVADYYLQQKKNPDKVHAYSAKIVEILSAKPKPEGVSDADWAARSRAEKYDHRPGAFHEREAICIRKQARADRPATAQGAPADRSQSGAEARDAVPARTRQLPDGQRQPRARAGLGELLPPVRRPQEPVPGNGRDQFEANHG